MLFGEFILLQNGASLAKNSFLLCFLVNYLELKTKSYFRFLLT